MLKNESNMVLNDPFILPNTILHVRHRQQCLIAYKYNKRFFILANAILAILAILAKSG